MKFIAYGLNHTTTPLPVREKYALAPEGVGEILRALKPTADEAVFLSTCNRVEFYLSTDAVKESRETILGALMRFHKLKPAEIKRYFYFYEDAEAFLHLFRVAASLDSMVVGEAQILGQVKEAYQKSREEGMAKAALTGIFNRALSAAKRVRSQTDIARMPVSVASVAVDLAQKIFTDLARHRVLLLGAGEMGELTAKYLVDAGVGGLSIASRTLERAKALAVQLGGKALSLEEGMAGTALADIVIASLGGGTTISKGDLEAVMKKRGGKPLFIIDIGVPRNVDPEAARLESLYLYNIDDLSSIAENNKGQRQKAVEAAETILRAEVEKLCSWLAGLELVPTVVRLREKFEQVRESEWREFLRKNPGFSEKDMKAVERLTRDMVGRLLHDPSVNLKKVENEMDRFEYARMLNEVFRLDGGRE